LPSRWSGHGYNAATKAPLWKRGVLNYANAVSGGDWHFMTYLLNSGATFSRVYSVLSARSTQRGRGRLFEISQPGWFEGVARDYDLEDVTGDGDWRLRLWKRGR
jgi:hypothetical protein